MKIIKTLLLSSVIAASSAYASEDSTDILLKIRGVSAFVDTKQSGLPSATSTRGIASPRNPGKIFENGLGGELSATMFFKNNIAAEVGSGLTVYRTKSSSTQAIEHNYSTKTQSAKAKDLFAVPTYLTIQYHIAPYGGFRPYVGAGYHYTYIHPKSNIYKFDHGSGLVVQAGLDLVFMDDSYLNFDFKQYMLESKVKYSTAFVNNNGKAIAGKLKMNPMVVGVGFGFKL